jgi:F0F1-type ATP synthase membrane subunit b/b'
MNLHVIHSKHKEMNKLQRFYNFSVASYWASLRETERILNEKHAEIAKEMKETDRRMKELQQLIGGIGNNNGEMAEYYV